MSTKSFIRLPATRRGVFRRASLWDAGDYLLSVNGSSFFESYRRYYYRDIKAIVVQQGPRLGSIGALLATAFCCIPLITVLFNPQSPVALRWVLSLPVWWLLWMIYVTLERSCRVFIFTAVSSEELPAIFRRRSATKALPRILNKIAEAQGSFSGERNEAVAIEPVMATPARDLPAPTASQQIPVAVGIFSLLFLGSAMFAYWYRTAPWNAASIISVKLGLGLLNAPEVACGVWAIFKLFRVRWMNSLRICVFAGFVVQALRSYSLIFLISLMGQPQSPINQAFSKAKLSYWVGTVDSPLSLVVGLAGLISLLLVWRGAEQKEALSSL